MGLARGTKIRLTGRVPRVALRVPWKLGAGLTLAILLSPFSSAQTANQNQPAPELSTVVSGDSTIAEQSSSHREAGRFLRGRSTSATVATTSGDTPTKVAPRLSSAQAMVLARRQHAALVIEQQKIRPELSPLSAIWQAVGPATVATAAYGNVSGRVTSVAIDPSDLTGNTVYVGTTGGGVWKSTNAMASAASVSFLPLTDRLPVFSGDAGSTVLPSLSIGAISVQGGIVLAGTGDPNDAADSYYGSGILRSADGGLTWSLVAGSRDGVG